MNPTSGGNTADMLQMLVNISGAFPAILMLVQAIFALIGLILFGQALIDLYLLNNENATRRAGKSVSPAGISWRVVVSVVLTSLVWWVDVTQNTLGGQDASSGLMMYQGAGMSAAQKMALEAIMGAFALVGYIAFGRGWLLLDKHFNGGNNGVSASIFHILGGTILIFLDLWLPRVGSWVGIDFVNILLF